MAVQYGNGIILGIYRSLPGIAGKIVIWGLTAVGVADFTGSLLFIRHMEDKQERTISCKDGHSGLQQRFQDILKKG